MVQQGCMGGRQPQVSVVKSENRVHSTLAQCALPCFLHSTVYKIHTVYTIHCSVFSSMHTAQCTQYIALQHTTKMLFSWKLQSVYTS